MYKTSKRGENREVWKLVDQFDSAYWSGLDVDYYIDNIALEDVVQVNYQVMERTQPYYGYADYTPARIYHGTRLIAGEISFNFKRHGYVFGLLDAIKKGESRTPTTTVSQKSDPTFGLNAVPGIGQAITATNIKSLSNPQVAEDFIQKMRTARITEKQLEKNFDQSKISSSRSIFETTRRGFDLQIVVGIGLRSAQLLRIDNTGDYIRDGAIFRTQQYPDHDLESATNARLPGSGLRIIGVELTSSAMSIADDGRSLIETHQFLAKDVRTFDRYNQPH